MPANRLEVDIQPFAGQTVDTAQLGPGPNPLQQHPHYGGALQAFGADTRWLEVRRGGDSLMAGLMLHRRFFRVIDATMGFMGPRFTEAASDEATRLEVLKALRGHFSPWRWRFLQLMPFLEGGDAERRLLKHAGYRRILTGQSTIWVDLSPSEADLRARLDGKWRNQLKKAEGEHMTIAVGGAKPKHYVWILEKEAEQRRERGYRAIPLGLVPAFAAAGDHEDGKPPLLSVTASIRGNPIAGALFLLHGTSATYHIGWVGEQGRDFNAQNLVMFNALSALTNRGIRWLDLGGINTGPGAGLARFKLGLGHAPTSYVGTYLG